MSSFKKAFASARKAGKDTFTWSGKKYTTELASGKSSAPEKSKRPEKKPRLMISGESPRAPKSTPKPKSRADRGTGAVTRSARPAAKPTRVAKDAKPQAETPTAVKTSVPSGKPTTQKSAPGKANFFSFFKGMAKGRGGLSDKKQGLKQKRGGLSDK